MTETLVTMPLPSTLSDKNNSNTTFHQSVTQILFPLSEKGEVIAGSGRYPRPRDILDSYVVITVTPLLSLDLH